MMILYDGEDFSIPDLWHFRNQVDAVLQNDRLFPATVRAHIVGMSPHGIEEAWRAAGIVGLVRQIASRPMG